MENYSTVSRWQESFLVAIAIATFEIYSWKFSGYLILICYFSSCNKILQKQTVVFKESWSHDLLLQKAYWLNQNQLIVKWRPFTLELLACHFRCSMYLLCTWFIWLPASTSFPEPSLPFPSGSASRRTRVMGILEMRLCLHLLWMASKWFGLGRTVKNRLYL